MNPKAEVALSLHNVTVRFGTFTAVDGISTTLRAGEIRAVLGENGAGKSTLMRVLAGQVTPASGQITAFGTSYAKLDADLALSLGIGMVYQHFMQVPQFTVAENFCLGLPRTGGVIPNLRRTAAEIAALAARYGFDIDPNARVETLSVPAQQRVEILKALYRGARILILDEPTAVLSPDEAQGLFAMVRALAAEGTAVLFISHKLHEIMDLCDSVTVIRRGKLVGERQVADTSEAELSRLMVGSDIPDLTRPPTLSVAPTPLLTLRGLNLGRGPLDLTLHKGEIFGIAGVDGSGQIELVETIMGLRRQAGLAFDFLGQDLTGASIKTRLAAGIAQIPEDRHKSAMVAEMSVADNLVLDRIEQPPFSKSGWINTPAITAEADRAIAAFDVRMQARSQPMGSLSGGNQQKVVLARALAQAPQLLLAVYPARGLDLGATRFVHQQLLARRAAGASVLLVSAELEELLSLSDRIGVMFDRRFAGILTEDDMTMANLGRLMAGAA
ncbi:D-allose transport system ATP-binding protein (plasmid) [Ketogulonicigenium robustum]|uniref:D-allose transport system ATP-binding protein n=1 Tax=Ketogulonicigenium robustum TaxID=92947 RepID=A0A1W6P399_9RHOB|nr:ABC transporter ATP-binding protein [Ketogulonicigenium robustum]ARO15820.1 D-allose transport system ATP-binding protein [Ketogulonicigenium robustum]